MQTRFTTAFVLKIIVDHLPLMRGPGGRFIYLKRCIGYIFTFGIAAWLSVVVEQATRAAIRRATGGNEKAAYFGGAVVASGVLIAGGAYFVNEIAGAMARAESGASQNERRQLLQFVPQEVTSSGMVSTTNSNIANLLATRSDRGYFFSINATNWAGQLVQAGGEWIEGTHALMSYSQLDALPITIRNVTLGRTRTISARQMRQIGNGTHG